MAVTGLLLPDRHTAGPNTRDQTPQDGESWLSAGRKINTAMVRSGQTTIDFGAFPGVTDVTVAVTGQDDIAAGATCEAFIVPTATVDHSADEHVVDSPCVYAGNVAAGVGFTIYGITNTNQLVYGTWTVGWRWSPNV